MERDPDRHRGPCSVTGLRRRRRGAQPARCAVISAGLVLGVVAGAVIGVVSPGIAAADPAPTAVVTITAQPSSGPVGTDIAMFGSVPPQCQGSMTISMSKVAGTPAVVLATSTETLGEWSSSLVVPPVAGATTNGPYTAVGPAAQIGPGTWTLRAAPAASAPGCAPATTTFTVTGFTPVTSRFVAMAAVPGGGGYWLVAAGGGVYSFGDAAFSGAARDGAGGGATALLASPGDTGYVITFNQPGVFSAFGSSSAPPDTGPTHITSVLVGAAATPGGAGIWEVGTDGSVLAYGDSGFYGTPSTAGVVPAGYVTAIAATPDAKGYWLLSSRGGVYSFGDAAFYGAAD